MFMLTLWMFLWPNAFMNVFLLITYFNGALSLGTILSQSYR